MARPARPLMNRIKLAIGRAVLRLVDDDRKLQTLQVEGLKTEVLDGLERFQQYGFTGHPHPGSEAIILALGGMRQHSIVIAIDDRRYRLTALAEGEVAIYSSHGQRIVLRNDESIEITAKSVAITSESLTHNGTNIGADHTHGGVFPGGARTSGPG